MSITENLQTIKNSLPQGVKLVAVSKFHPEEALREAYNAGQLIFGESKVQEMDEKHNVLPADIQWHFIGHLQTNKVKYIVPYVSLIHSADSNSLLIEIEKQANKINRKINCLLQVHVAKEETKFGFTPDELLAFLKKEEWHNYKHICFCGIMGMASNTDNKTQIRQEFCTLKNLFDNIKSNYFANESCFSQLSMGMSGDYHIAIEEGSTLVRIGTAIFGDRQY